MGRAGGVFNTLTTFLDKGEVHKKIKTDVVKNVIVKNGAFRQNLQILPINNKNHRAAQKIWT